MTLLSLARTAGSSAGGALLATATRSLAVVRPAAKPLHPEGDLVRGRGRVIDAPGYGGSVE